MCQLKLKVVNNFKIIKRFKKYLTKRKDLNLYLFLKYPITSLFKRFYKHKKNILKNFQKFSR